MPALNIPHLEDYDIDPVTGFLPREPLKRLPDPYYEPWECVVDDLNGLLLAGRLRERVHKLPVLDTTRLRSQREYQRAFLVLCLLSHGCVWGKHEVVSEVLPACLAVPWTKVATHLGLFPVVCHAAVVLWNWRKLFSDGPIDLRSECGGGICAGKHYREQFGTIVKTIIVHPTPLHSNITTLATYSGSVDESWFYLVTTAIEAVGAPSLTAIVNAIRAISERNHDALLSHFRTIHDSLQKLNATFVRMYEKCDPYVFYWKIRPYLAGWENMAEAGLPFGLIYEGVDTLWEEGTDYYADMSHLTEAERFLRQYRKYAGGSAAQSSLIHALDIFFGVEHYPTGDKRKHAQNQDKTFVTRTTDEADPNIDKNDRYNNLPATEIADPMGNDNKPHNGTPPAPNRNNFIQAMRGYMPGPHRRFLEDLSKVSNVRSYMLKLAEEEEVERGRNGDGDDDPLRTELLHIYNTCLHELKLFRDKHVQMVSLYIINQARKGPSIAHGGFAIANGEEASKQNVAPPTPPPSTNSSTATAQISPPVAPVAPMEKPVAKGYDIVSPKPKGPGFLPSRIVTPSATNILYPQTVLSTSPSPALISQMLPALGLAKSQDPNSSVFRGTGGTNLMPFLKQSRDETLDAKIVIDGDAVDEGVKVAGEKEGGQNGWGTWLTRR
ncbi:hypothetical protein BC938DRAFT_479133 [Jimgerdemannia flammicorona]|uniref:Indoleamine 2,3-dioxygenase n=1 Tax=Jimgerdemannia flammicorona TaxID=994334 RepID=A0A433QLI9_9FUNG|nr:hypothetical protein BC938DRAFT_479133 [Jimgerdemannia flammicorona]